jgi:hypothetical protein
MPPKSRLDVHQHLTVDGVRQTGSSVRVEVADRDGNRHWISFRFSDVEPAAVHAERLEQWKDRGTPLTYVRGDGHGALVDDEELFRRAYESA